MGDAADGPRQHAQMAGYYQLIEGFDGGFAFALRAGNHGCIFESRVFWSRQAALDAVERFRTLVQDDRHLVAVRNDKGQHVLELRDTDQRTMGQGNACNSAAGLSASRAALRRNAPAPGFRGLVRRTLVLP